MGPTLNRDSLRNSMTENGYDPDMVIEALEEFLAYKREFDLVQKDILGLDTYYEREIRYSKLEKFCITLRAT